MVPSGDNEHPRHIVRAVTMLRQRLGEPRVPKSATTVGQP